MRHAHQVVAWTLGVVASAVLWTAEARADAPLGAELCSGGCPVADRDKDGVPDEVDACPDAPETQNGFEDGDGCPDEAGAQLVGIARRVAFDTASSALRGPATAALKDMAAELRSAAGGTVGVIDLVGYADQRGAADANQKLSEARADAVLRWLVAHGVPAERLHAIGAGVLPGLDTATMEANRRVEIRAELERRKGLAAADRVPEAHLPSGWRIQRSGGGRAVVVDPAGLLYTAYAVVKVGDRYAVYARAATLAEVDAIVLVQGGAVTRVALRARPGATGGTAVAGVPKVWLEDAPAAPGSACTGPTRKTVKISSTTGWQASGVTVAAGERFSIEAKGKVHTCYPSGCGDDCYARWAGPEGNTGCPKISGAPVPDAASMSLIGRIGDSAGFLIGPALTTTADRAGELAMTVNDDGLYDNSGDFEVDVVRCPAEGGFPFEDANYWGHELKVVHEQTDPQACARLCDQTPECRIASYHDSTTGEWANTCVLRDAVGERHTDQPGIRSWVKPGNASQPAR